ncbi:uncharacterized protein LOC110018994 isoform X2 [Phalaenopsis equestris]|uniref:uncharacterized protein LOC110018994 isoform X2 n=1 Tax=Phalaenopsis equestris TaxID=78828 RepID=UPI0009E5AF9A|nr:uncharacterized protein LOC110018994 isoform X2 [Phalaenopsis equestris]
MRIESGTCNVCSAPCSSCRHHNRSMSAIGSKNESGFSSIICARGEEADSSSVFNLGDMKICKSTICNDLQHVASETSNLISATSSHDSYFENADSKAVFRASTVYDASDDVDMPQDVSSCEFVEQVRSLKRKQIFSPGQDEEQSELECHGDNILYTSEGRDANVSGSDCNVHVEKKDLECSNIIINSSFNVNNKAIPNEGGCGKIGRKLNVTGNASSLDDICNSVSVNTFSTAKSQLPLSECGVSPEENIRCVEGDSVKASIASLTAGSSEPKSNTFTDHEVSTPTQIKSGFSSSISKIDESCRETRSVTDLQKSFNGGSKGSNVKAPLERIGTILDSTNGQGHQTQAITEGENSDSDVMLDDVKVCDICGDAGREDLLAICSSCSDGAEHTYCMSQMLLKVPEGDWLCEECKMKESKNQNADEYEEVSESLNLNYLNEGNKKALSTPFPKKLPKLNIGPTDLVTKRPSKGLQSSHNLTPRQADHPEEVKSSERNGTSMETASPRKKPTLSRQISLKNQVMEKVNTAIIPALTEVHSTKSSEAFSRSKVSLSSSSFKGQPHPHSPHGLLSRSVSFSYSNNVPKVKTLIEKPPHKQKITRESANIDLRKEVSVKSLTRNTSFSNTTSGRPHTESVSKSSSFKPSHIEGLRGPKESKERSFDGRNNISAKQNSIFRPSAVITSHHPIKVDAKHVHGDGKIKNIPETDVPCSSKGFNDANDLGSSEGKKQALYSSKNSDGNSKFENLKKPLPLNKGILSSTSAIDGSNRKVELVSPHSAVQSSESGRKDESLRNSPCSTGSRLSSFGGSQKLRCQKCNETGHVIQHCSNNKLQKSTNNLAADGNSNEVVKKNNKWREVVEAAISRSRVLKGNKADACEELPAAKTDLNCVAVSKNAPNAIIQRNSVLTTSKDLNIDSTKNLASANSGQSAVLPVEVSHVSKVDDQSHCLPIDKLSAKPFVESLQDLAPFLANTIRASAIPKLECIWQGNFNVLGIGNCPENFDGIQAHLSSCASRRVFEAAIKIPGSVHLEEVSHISLWPSHFQRIGPQEENIALFFFAKDEESYDRSYRRLMDRLHKNDLALRGSMDGFEILIFTSNKLPMKSQRWNMMYYLWGMFRARSGYGLPLMCGQKKSSMPNLDLELPNQDLSIPPINLVCNAQNSETSIYLNNLSEFRPSTITPGTPADSLDVLPISSGISDKACRRLEASVQNSLSQVVADPNVPLQPLGKHSFPVEKSSGMTADLLTVTDSPKSMRLMSASNSFSEERKDRTFPKKLVSDCTNRNTVDLSTFAYNTGEESNLRRASSVPLNSLNCNKGDEFGRIERNLRDKVCSTSSVAIMDVDDPTQNALDVERLNNKKRGPSLLSSEDEREPKKNCYATDSVTETNASNRLSSKIHPLYSCILSPQMEEQIYREPVLFESSRTTERCFFPTDLCPVQNNKSANIIHIPSSDDEAIPESCSPDLELALGGKSKLAKPMASPLPFTSVGGKQHIQPGSSGYDGDDLSASLSLSLAFPAAEREGSAKCILEKEPILPEKPSANTPLFLFGRFSNP